MLRLSEERGWHSVTAQIRSWRKKSGVEQRVFSQHVKQAERLGTGAVRLRVPSHMREWLSVKVWLRQVTPMDLEVGASGRDVSKS